MKFILLENKEVEQDIIDHAEQTLYIEQKYLTIEKGLSVRIRSSVNENKGWQTSLLCQELLTPFYLLTVKKDINEQVIEIETLITKDDFVKLWPAGYNKVVKTRYLYQGWEIDFFKTNTRNNYFAIAEIEMPPLQKEPETIPNLINNYILFAAPINDKRFSNKKLGDIKYATSLLENIKKKS